MLPPNTKTIRELLTELQPGQHVVMHDPKKPQRVITQCVRVSEHVYYLVGPQFNDFTLQLRHPALHVEDGWLLPELFRVAREDNTSEAEMVELINGFLHDLGAWQEARVFTCTSLADVITTLAGLYAVG